MEDHAKKAAERALVEAIAPSETESLTLEIKNLRAEIAGLRASNESIPKRLIAGMASGLGTVLGATVVLSIAVYLLKPLEHIETLSPGIKQLIETLQKDKGKASLIVPTGGLHA